MKGTRRRVASLAILGLWTLACASVEEIEREDVGDPANDMSFENPAAAEGQLELDNQLCWEQSRTDVASVDAARQAHQACMAERGWSPK
jgi:hypothetical protein